MRLESSRPPRAGRRAPGPTLTQATTARLAVARGGTALPLAVRDAALAASAALVLTGRGDLWVLAVTLGMAAGSALTTLTVVLAAVATLARIGSAALSDVTGSQAVLGAAGVTGSTMAVAAAWASAASLALAGRQRTTGAALGALGGVLVAGPSLAGGSESVRVWIAGIVVGAGVGWLLAASPKRARWQPLLAIAVGVVGVGLGVVAGYV